MPNRLLNLDELAGYTQANPYAVPFGGTGELSAAALSDLVARLTPEQQAALMQAATTDYTSRTVPLGLADVTDRQQTMDPVYTPPTYRERAEDLGLSAFGSDSRGRRRTQTMIDALDVIDPGLMTLSDAKAAFGRGDAISGTVDTVLGMAGVIPGAEAVTPIVRKGIKNIREASGVGRAKKRVGSTGQYVGAPAGMNTPQKLGAMRKRYKERVVAGEEGKNWYQDSSDFISRVTDDTDEARTRAADVLGLTSSNTPVDANLGFAIKGINQFAAGEPVQSGQFWPTQSPVIENILRGKDIKYYPKLTPFMRNLAVNWNPDLATTPVHDIWQGRAFGYKGPVTKKYPEGKPFEAGFSPQQHSFMDEQTDFIIDDLAKLGKEYDPLSVQAAAWTGQKIADGKVKPGEGALHYGDYSPKYRAAGTYEQVPGMGTGHLEGIVNMPFGQRQEFTDIANWMNPQGRDRLYASTGMLVEPTVPGMGSFTSSSGMTEFNPANVAGPLVQTDGVVRTADASLLNTVEGARAYIDAQNAGAWHRVIPDNQTTAGERTSLELNLGRPVTLSEMQQLNDLAVNNGYFAVDYGSGVRFINDEYGESDLGRIRKAEMAKPNQRFGMKDAKAMQAEIDNIISDAPNKVTRAKIDSDYLDFEESLKESAQGSRAATGKLFKMLDDHPKIRDAIEVDLVTKAEQNYIRDAKFARDNDLPVREDIQNARKILFTNKGGLNALRAAYNNKELLPAVISAILAPSFFGTDQEI